jgi:hypothetical protein
LRIVSFEHQSIREVPEHESRAAVRRLLLEVVDSFEKLELVVHLHRTGAGSQTTATLAAALGIPSQAVDEALSELMRDGLVRETDQNGWSFDPNSPRASAVDVLVQLYGDDRLDVMTLMSQLALERVRAQVATAFADAFVLRPRKTKGDSDA